MILEYEVFFSESLRFTGYCSRHKDEMAFRRILWLPAHGTYKKGRPEATYIHSLKDDVDLKTWRRIVEAINIRLQWPT